MTRVHKLSLFGTALGTGLALLLIGVAAPRPSHAGPIAAAGPGAALGTKPYTISVVAPAAKVGAKGAATVTMKPGSGYHLNTEFPLSLKLTLPDGVTTPKAELKKADAKTFKEAEGSFDIPFVAASAGQKTIQGELRFAVCTETTCEPQRTQVTITLDVKP